MRISAGLVLSDSVRRNDDPQPFGFPRRLHVEVEEDLGVVGHEADRHREHAPRAPGLRRAQRVLHRRAQPRLRRASGALVRALVTGQADRRRDRGRGPLDLARVGVPGLDQPHRQAVGGEQDEVGAVRARRPGFLRERRDESRVVVPALDAAHLDPGRRGLAQHVAVAGDAHGRELRGERDAHQRAGAGGHRLLHDVGDEGMPVAHPDVHRGAVAQLLVECRGLGAGDVGERRPPADGAVVRPSSPRSARGTAAGRPRTRARYSGIWSSDSGVPWARRMTAFMPLSCAPARDRRRRGRCRPGCRAGSRGRG